MSVPIEQIFEQEMLRYGGKLPRDLPDEYDATIIGPYRDWLDERLRQIRRSGKSLLKSTYVDIVSNPTFNARAFIVKNREFVGLNSGVSVSIPLFIGYILSDPRAFPEIGDPSIEVQRPTSAVSELLLYFGNDLKREIDYSPRVPTDKNRYSYFLTLQVISWDFLLAHELAHIFRCHLHYLKETGFRDYKDTASIVLHEFDERTPQAEAELRRTLEADADSWAAHVTVQGILRQEGGPNDFFMHRRLSTSSSENHTWSEVCLTWLRAVALLYLVMAIRDENSSVQSYKTHPHPDVRLRILASAASQDWENVIPEDEYYAIFVTVRDEIEALGREGILPIPVARISNTYKQEYDQAATELFSQLKECTPRLDSLMRERIA